MSEENVKKRKRKLNKAVIVGMAAIIVIMTVVVLMKFIPRTAAANKLTEQLNLGDKYLSELNYEQAKVAYLKVIEIDPKNVDAYLGLADAYLAQNEYEMAIDVLEDALGKLDGDAAVIRAKLQEIERRKAEAEATSTPIPTNTPMPTATPTPTSTPTPTVTPTPTEEERMAELLKDYSYEKNETGYTIIWLRNQSKTKITIPEGVTIIAPGAFENCTTLESVELPDTLEEIGGKEIPIGSNGVYIQGAFKGCKSLKKIELPQNLKLIGAGAFMDSGLTEVVIPDSVIEIGPAAFWGAKDLESVVWPANLRVIGGNAFRETAISECILPEGVTFIGYQAFMFCDNLNYIYVPGTVEEIEHLAFDGCPQLSEIYLADGVKQLGNMVFNTNNALLKLTIPASVTSIGENNYLAEGATIYTPKGSVAESYFSMDFLKQNEAGEWVPYTRYTIVNEY